MYKTYKAELHHNNIKWIDSAPDETILDKNCIVYITLLDSQAFKGNNNSLVEFFQKSPFSEIDSIEFEREVDFGREIKL
jgi:hypothetical protein